MKELKIEVPQGYEIDKENSTFECIKFKKKQEIKTWEDLCETGAISKEIRLSGYYIDERSNIRIVDQLSVVDNNRDIFLTKKEAKSAIAAAIISQLMPYYGGAIKYNEWNDKYLTKYTIKRFGTGIRTYDTCFDYTLLAFRTEALMKEFLKHNGKLVKEYLMLD